MTRRGSIAYYLAGIVCGSFFLAASYYGFFLWTGASSQHWGRDFLYIYMLTIPLALLPQVLGAWALRRLARRFAWRSLALWLVVGPLIWLGVLWVIGQLGVAVQATRGTPGWYYAKLAAMFVLVGPMYAVQQPLWIPLPAAVATAWVLFTVHRAFEEQPEEQK
jgi:hypothetical protein